MDNIPTVKPRAPGSAGIDQSLPRDCETFITLLARTGHDQSRVLKAGDMKAGDGHRTGSRNDEDNQREAEPASDFQRPDRQFLERGTPGTLTLIELILKDGSGLERVIRQPDVNSDLVPRFLAIALLGFTLFGVALSVVIGSVGTWPEPTSIRELLTGADRGLIQFGAEGPAGGIFRPWWNGSAPKLVAAYNIGMIAAAGVCLPSLYFYGLLSGVKMSMLDVVSHTVKALAVTAVALVGILPVYVAIAMGVAIFPFPPVMIHQALWLGLLLPFVAGLWGIRSLYVGFTALACTLPIELRYRRHCFLHRLVLSWAACYTAVTPVMVFTLWEYFMCSVS